MFRGGQPNPYDDIVVKATDENQTSENWEIILNLCDKVVDEGEQGARSVIAAVLKRLVHRNPNVQLYALAVVEALSKNCGVEVHREIASRSFTQGLERLVTDRTAHDKVKRKALSLIAMWTEDFEKDPSLSIMEECYTSLKQKNFKFDAPTEPPPPQVDDEIRRREEEELQRVLEMSMHDKGGRQQWAGYSAAASSNSNGAGASGSTASVHRTAAAPAAAAAPSYAPAPAPAPSIPAPAPAPVAASSYRTPSPAAAAASAAVPTSPISPSGQASVTRVRALHTFEPTEPGELAFEKGDIIKVVDRNYKDWWRGQLRGRTGIFPVNYVEPLPDPTPAELAREAEQEAAVFAQAANIDKLLTMLRSFDPAKDNLADNEEIQELYRQSMSLRPKIVKLIDKYSQKRADLVFMNESFVKARGIFERMMEDSLARHTGLYGGRQPAGPQRPQQGPAPYAWNPALYDQAGYPGVPYNAGTPGAYGPQQQQTPGAYGPAPAGYGPSPAPPTAAPYQPPEGGQQYPPQPYQPPEAGQQYPPQPYPAAYGQPQQGAPQQPAGPHQPAGQDPNAPHYGQPTPYGQPQPYSPGPQQQHGQHPQQHVPGQAAPQQQQHVPGQPGPQQQPHQHVPGQDPHAQQQQQQYPGYAQQQQQHPAHQQPGQQQQPAHQQPGQQQQQPQQPAATPAPASAQAGPIQPQPDGRYIFDPQGTYADPNVQAWAQYYAQGGADPAGSVYFVSVPGVTDGAATVPPQAQAQPQPQEQQPQQAAPEPDPTAGAPPAQFAGAPPNGHAPELPPITATGSFDFQPQSAVVGSPVQPGFPTYAPEGVPLATSPPPVQHQPGYVQQMSHQFGNMALHEPPQAAPAGAQPAPA
ncbi:hypothetical protein AURDEDRAFT_144151 [Auricularia subglabra TFB-10046 SS5]|nr:hypothetical protein AURDEDRAFT_144151 [Auricularia subglabra TFB-10046 SS5]